MTYGSISDRKQQEVFENGVGETIIELYTIINHFEKYGDPKSRSTDSAQVNLSSNEISKKEQLVWIKEANFTWFLRNTPVNTLWGFGAVIVGLIVGSFIFGMHVEKRWPETKSRIDIILVSPSLLE